MIRLIKRLFYPWTIGKIFFLCWTVLYVEISLGTLPDLGHVHSDLRWAHVTYRGSGDGGTRDMKAHHLYLDTDDFLGGYIVPPLENGDELNVLERKLVNVEWAENRWSGIFSAKKESRHILFLAEGGQVYVGRNYAIQFYDRQFQQNVAILAVGASLYLLLFVITVLQENEL